MPDEIVYRPLDPVTVYAVTGRAEGMGPEFVGPLIGGLVGQLDAALVSAGRPILEPAVFWYESTGDGGMAISVSQAAEQPPVAGEGYTVVELPAVPLAACIRHHGDMSTIADTWARLTARLESDGHRMVGASREVYLEAPGHVPGPDWVTEIQVPVEPV